MVSDKGGDRWNPSGGRKSVVSMETISLFGNSAISGKPVVSV